MIDNYIVDFYCHSARLIVEPDGSQHYEEKGLQKGRIRTERIEKRNLTVIRIPNNEITGNFEGVCDYIDNMVKESLRQSATDTSLWAREAMIIGGLFMCEFTIHKNSGI